MAQNALMNVLVSICRNKSYKTLKAKGNIFKINNTVGEILPKANNPISIKSTFYLLHHLVLTNNRVTFQILVM